MKFGKYLERHSVSEWKKKYVFYKQFKKQIKAIKRALHEEELTVISPTTVSTELSGATDNNSVEFRETGGVHMTEINGNTETTEEAQARITKTKNIEREEGKFDQMIKDEVEKVNSFYLLQENEFSCQFDEIKYRVGLVAQKKADDLTASQVHTNNRDSNDHSIGKSLVHLFHQPSIRKRFRHSGELDENQIPPQPSNEAQKALAHAGSAETNWGGGQMKYSKIRRSLKRALEENYREIEVLKEYITLNHTAFRKIFKKYDKVLGRAKSSEYLKMISEQYFSKSKKIFLIERDIEQFYMNTFKHGNRRDAMAKLRVPKDFKPSSTVVFFTGQFLGMSIILFIFSVRYMIGNVPLLLFTPNYPTNFLSIFILLRFIFIPLLLIWYMGILFYICNGKNLNLLMILGWDARTHITHYHILLLASVLTFFWNLALFLYIYLGIHIEGRLPVLFPIILLVMVFIILFCPFDIFFRHSRFWLLNTFRRFMSAPFLPVKFKDFFLGDQLTSLSIIFSDLVYVTCFFVSDFWTGHDVCWRIHPITKPILISIPHLFRALQSIRRYRDTKQRIHMVNCGKYSMNILTIITSSIAHYAWKDNKTKTGLIVMWIFVATISTIYSSLWDFLMDWGVLRTNCRHFLLRHHLFYKHKNVYYFAILSNLAMRVSWAINISFESYSSKSKEIIVLATSIIEVTRRFQWNFFRLENEHLSNCEKFKAFDLKLPETFPGMNQKITDIKTKMDKIYSFSDLVGLDKNDYSIQSNSNINMSIDNSNNNYTDMIGKNSTSNESNSVYDQKQLIDSDINNSNNNTNNKNTYSSNSDE